MKEAIDDDDGSVLPAVGLLEMEMTEKNTCDNHHRDVRPLDATDDTDAAADGRIADPPCNWKKVQTREMITTAASEATCSR